jgi:SAM-dependent methyltransferase
VTADSNPFNYRYFIDHAAQIGGRMLDYGCGVGQMVTLGRERGLDIWGADTYAGYYSEWSKAVSPIAQDRILRIKNDRAGFPDAHFDLVLSNQVLEHVTDPEASIADIYRLVRPGGMVIAAFPVTSTWYEGHIGLYFAHNFKKGSNLRNAYFRLARRLGFGLYHRNATPEEWAKISARTLDDACFYYPHARMMRAFENIFGAQIEDMSVDYMRTRLGSRVAALPDPLLRFIYHKRAGEIFMIRKPKIRKPL